MDVWIIHIIHGLEMSIENAPRAVPRMTGSSRTPFIGKNEPNVDIKNSRFVPNIGINRPFVRKDNSNSGFTLIELMITVVVAGILLSLGIPSMRTFIQNARITGQANDFISDLNFARTEAIKRGANVTICKSSNPTAATPACVTTGSDWAIGRIVFIDVATGSPAVVNGVYDAGETLLRIREPLEGGNTLNVNDTSAGGANAQNLIVYTGSGGTTIGTALTATFNLCDERGATKGRAIAIGFRGKLTVSKPPASCT